jgi:hypothetical protein
MYKSFPVQKQSTQLSPPFPPVDTNVLGHPVTIVAGWPTVLDTGVVAGLRGIWKFYLSLTSHRSRICQSLSIRPCTNTTRRDRCCCRLRQQRLLCLRRLNIIAVNFLFFISCRRLQCVSIIRHADAYNGFRYIASLLMGDCKFLDKEVPVEVVVISSVLGTGCRV